MDATTIIAGAVGGFPAILAAYFAYKASVRASDITEQQNRITVTKVDAEAYERSQKFYEAMLAEAEKTMDRLRVQIDRLNDQVDHLNTQLASEQDVSNVLRNQIRALTTQISYLEQTLNELQSGMARAADAIAHQHEEKNHSE